VYIPKTGSLAEKDPFHLCNLLGTNAVSLREFHSQNVQSTVGRLSADLIRRGCKIGDFDEKPQFFYEPFFQKNLSHYNLNLFVYLKINRSNNL